MKHVTKRMGWLPLALACVEFALLAATESPLNVRNGIYGCSSFCGSSMRGLVPDIVTAFGACIFIEPLLIGVTSRAWSSAVALAALPWWLAVILRSRTLLTPYIGLSQTNGRFDDPFWISPAHLAPILMSFALFAGLGALGWLVARPWREATRASE